MFGITLNPLHYILALFVVTTIGLGLNNWRLSLNLKNAETTLEVVKIQREMDLVEAKQKDKIAKLAKKKEEDEYKRNLDSIKSDNDRLRKQLNKTRLLPSTPQVCTGSGETTSIDWPLIEQAIREFRNETRSLIEEGDKEREGLDSVKGWYFEQ